MSIFDYKDCFKEIENIPCELVWEMTDGAPLTPQVTVIMPVYTNHDFFRIALRSALEQDWSGSYEVVVVDNDTAADNPNQHIVEEFNDPRVRYFRNAENIGMTGNWNRGISLARGRQITFLHDDDMFMPTTLSTLMKVSARHPGKLVISTLRPIDVNGVSWVDDSEYELHRRWGILKPREVAKMSLARALCSNLGNLVGALFDRQRLISLGGFHTEAFPPLDYELAVRYIRLYGAVKLRRPGAYYRFADNTSFKIYASMGPKQREIAGDIIRHIPLPHSVMRRVADTYCKYVDTSYRAQFAPPDEKANHHISALDRRLTSLYTGILNLIEGYHISI